MWDHRHVWYGRPILVTDRFPNFPCIME